MHRYTNLRGLVGDKQTPQYTYGVVSDVGETMTATKEPYDKYCRYTLVDPSILDGRACAGVLNVGFRLTVFSNDKAKLPKVLKIGDVIRLHRVICQKYGNDQRMVATARIDHRGFSFLLLDGAPGSSFDAYQSSHEKNSPISIEQRDNINTLRNWYVHNYKPAHENANRNEQLSTIGQRAGVDVRASVDFGNGQPGKKVRKLFEDINALNLCFSCICKVFHKEFVDAAEGKMLQLLVWDSTSCPQLSQINMLEGISGRYSWERRLGANGLKTLPDYGSVLAVVARDRTAYEPLLEITEGQWVILRRVYSKSYFGRLEIEFSSFSSVRILPVFDTEVQNLEERYRQVLLSRCNPMSDSRWIPPQLSNQTPRVTRTTEIGRFPFCSLRQCLQGTTGMHFKIAARVVGISPNQLEHACVPEWEGGPLIFAVSLCLEDSTGRLDAHLVKGHAVYFFNGVLPADFRHDTGARDALAKRIDLLLGFQPGGFQNAQDIRERALVTGSRTSLWADPPWLELCLEKIGDTSFIISLSQLVV